MIGPQQKYRGKRMPDWASILAELGVADETPLPVSGGDISAAWRVGDLFLKTGPVTSFDMFSAEAEGLEELAAAQAVRVPRVQGCNIVSDTAFIALEWLEFERPTRDTEARFGEQLAALHQVTQQRFGWHRDNTIGLTPQRNDPSDNWVDFFREHRLGFQLRLARENGFSGSLQAQGAQLLKRLPVFFEDYEPRPALLHGDLWGGNWGSCDGAPVIFDPAVYYGDPESDLAMTRLFGGFGRAFYDAYAERMPPASGSHDRSDLYQLYHVLNHLNLFGSGYLGRAEGLIHKLL
ncbi:MAG: fructosamine kinase family protein [Gammaproteobacteria bacterium]|nr:fructosamine kinase family protein [Gammaproteobacteria bacterium]